MAKTKGPDSVSTINVIEKLRTPDDVRGIKNALTFLFYDQPALDITQDQIDACLALLDHSDSDVRGVTLGLLHRTAMTKDKQKLLEPHFEVFARKGMMREADNLTVSNDSTMREGCLRILLRFVEDTDCIESKVTNRYRSQVGQIFRKLAGEQALEQLLLFIPEKYHAVLTLNGGGFSNGPRRSSGHSDLRYSSRQPLGVLTVN